MKRIKGIDLLLFILLGPLFPTPAAAANKFMVENLPGKDPAGNVCYDFITTPACTTSIAGLIITTSTFSNVFNSTNTWTGQNIFTSPAGITVSTVTLNGGFLLGAELNHYRRPNLIYNSATVVNIESGLDGTTNVVTLLFPDGQFRNDTSTTRTQCNLAQVANFTSGANQSGVRTGTVAVNTWYAIYAVKGSNSNNAIVAVADTVLPLQTNVTTLNTNFGGPNTWVYIGLVRNGDNSGATTGILQFSMSGSITLFSNTATSANGTGTPGTLLATSAGTVSIAYTYSAGTGSVGIPNNIVQAFYTGGAAAGGTAGSSLAAVSGNPKYFSTTESAINRTFLSSWMPAQQGVTLIGVASTAKDISIAGFTDGVLGVGSNPQL